MDESLFTLNLENVEGMHYFDGSSIRKIAGQRHLPASALLFLGGLMHSRSRKWRSLVHSGSNYANYEPRLSVTFFIGLEGGGDPTRYGIPAAQSHNPFEVRANQENGLAQLLSDVLTGNDLGKARNRFRILENMWRGPTGGKRLADGEGQAPPTHRERSGARAAMAPARIGR